MQNPYNFDGVIINFYSNTVFTDANAIPAMMSFHRLDSGNFG